MNIFDMFPPEIAMRIAKMVYHPVADIFKQYLKDKQERIRRECELEDMRTWQQHYYSNYNVYQYI